MSHPLVQVRSVKKSYGNRTHAKKALKGVSFDIHEGEILSLLGVNGAGKTTLSTILAGLHPCDSGNIFYKGHSIYQDIVSYRRMVGYCPQQANLDATLTLRENLEFSGRYYLMSSEDIAIQMNYLMDRFHLGEYADSKVSTLSGGYKQRFLIARTLMHRPKLVILDEPTVCLDPCIRRQLWEEIVGLKRDGISVLLTTHALDEAEYLSDHVCIIDAGLIEIMNTPKNLMMLHKKRSLEDVFMKLMGTETNRV